MPRARPSIDDGRWPPAASSAARLVVGLVDVVGIRLQLDLVLDRSARASTRIRSASPSQPSVSVVARNASLSGSSSGPVSGGTSSARSGLIAARPRARRAAEPRRSARTGPGPSRGRPSTTWPALRAWRKNVRLPGSPTVPATKRSGGSKRRVVEASDDCTGLPSERRRGQAPASGLSATMTWIVWWPRAPSGAGGVTLGRSGRRRCRRSPGPRSCARPGRHAVASQAYEPLDPGRLRDRRRERAPPASAAVDRDLDLRDAAVRRPGDAGDRRPGRPATCWPLLGHVDPRLGQDRALLRPAERDPVAVEGLERRQLELGQPLRRRDVAVQARDDQPGREAVDPRQRARRSSSARSSARAPGPSPTRSACPRSSRRPTGRRAGSRRPGRRPSSRTSRSWTPVHFALPTRLPPTSLLTQAIVTYCSNSGSSARSA